MGEDKILLTDLKLSDNNPRTIKDEKFKQLCKSIIDFPEMLPLRPIIVDEDNTVLGGNMRVRAMLHLKFKTIPKAWVKQALGLSESQKKEFMIKDNNEFGEWDWDILANEFDPATLVDFGLDIPDFKAFKPEMLPDVEYDEVTEKELQEKAEQLAKEMLKQSKYTTTMCPYCNKEFEIDLGK